MRDTHTTFRPTYWRCYLLVVLPWLLGVVLASVVGARSDSTPFIIISGVLMGLLTTPWTQTHLTITITDADVSGPARWGWQRVNFPLPYVDCTRSGTPTLLQRFGGYQYIRSTDGHTITVNSWAFDAAQVTHLLTQLGCAGA